LYLLLVLALSSGLAAQETSAGSASAPDTSAAKTSVPKTAPGEMLASYEGQNVASIEFAGQPDVDPDRFSSAVAQKIGEPFSQQKVEQTAAAIKSAGKYEGVRVRVDPESNGVRIRFVLEPAVYIGIFKFPGAGQFPYSRLIQVANYPVQAPFNASEIERDRKRLLDYYRQAGFFQAEVRSEVEVDRKREIANVSFATTLGRRAIFGDIVINGVPTPEQERLRASLQTTMARARTVAIRPGKKYRRSTIGKAATYLQTQLEKKGLLDAQVKLAGAEYHADTNRADIHFDIVPGPTIKVDIQGAHIWPWTRKSLLPFYQGIDVDDESVEEGRLALASYFQSK
jgi:outer membrane protein assembly factor BamA